MKKDETWKKAHGRNPVKHNEDVHSSAGPIILFTVCDAMDRHESLLLEWYGRITNEGYFSFILTTLHYLG